MSKEQRSEHYDDLARKRGFADRKERAKAQLDALAIKGGFAEKSFFQRAQRDIRKWTKTKYENYNAELDEKITKRVSYRGRLISVAIKETANLNKPVEYNDRINQIKGWIDTNIEPFVKNPRSFLKELESGKRKADGHDTQSKTALKKRKVNSEERVYAPSNNSQELLHTYNSLGIFLPCLPVVDKTNSLPKQSFEEAMDIDIPKSLSFADNPPPIRMLTNKPELKTTPKEKAMMKWTYGDSKSDLFGLKNDDFWQDFVSGAGFNRGK